MNTATHEVEYYAAVKRDKDTSVMSYSGRNVRYPTKWTKNEGKMCSECYLYDEKTENG